jgi:hypothetical protein
MSAQRPACQPRHAWPQIATLGVALVMLLAGATCAAEPKAPTVRLVIDFGDGVEVHFTALKWRQGLTVLDALSAARSHPRGLAFSQRGSGRNALVTQIGDVKNEGGAADSRNWMYYVNGKAPDVGAGVQELKPGDAVLWKFQVYDYNS